MPSAATLARATNSRATSAPAAVGRIADDQGGIRAAGESAARKLRRSRPTVTVMGPLDGVEDYDRIAARLA